MTGVTRGRSAGGRTPRHGKLRAARLVLLLAALAFTQPTAVASQDDALPEVFRTLAGEWEGSGTLLGNSAAFRMTWTPLRDDFVRLSFQNMWIDENGDTVPVLSAEATYRVAVDSALGVWIDDRPQQLTLSASIGDTSVVTDWVAPAETGRTEYVVTSPDAVVVRDYVIADGVPRLFAEGTYTRMAATGR